MHAFERFGGLRNDLAPVRARGLGDINGDHAAARGIQIGVDPKERAVVVNKTVLGIKIIEQLHHGRAGQGEVLIVEPVAGVGAFGDVDEQVMAIVSHGGAEAPVFMIRAIVHQAVGGLRRPDDVIIDFLEIIHLGELSVGLGLIVAGIEKAFAILGPGRAGEFHPFQGVGQVLAGADIADLPFLPVGTGGGQPVGHELAIVANGHAGEGDGAIGGKFVGIEQHGGLGV